MTVLVIRISGNRGTFHLAVGTQKLFLYGIRIRQAGVNSGVEERKDDKRTLCLLLQINEGGTDEARSERS